MGTSDRGVVSRVQGFGVGVGSVEFGASSPFWASGFSGLGFRV